MRDPDFAALWGAFRAKDRDRVLVGVAAAFSLVAAANGALEDAETLRFLEVVAGSRLAPADPATRAQLAQAFQELVQALLSGPGAGRAECLRVLSEFGFDPMRREIIWSAASAALVADAALDPAERKAAAEIRDALRIGASG